MTNKKQMLKPSMTAPTTVIKNLINSFFAKKLSMTDAEFNKFLNSEIPIDEDIASKLSVVLNIPIDFFIELQALWNYEQMRNSIGESSL